MSDMKLPPHDGGAFAPVPARLVASWPAGTFVENLVVGADGAVFVTVHPAGEVWRVSPSGETRLLATLPTPVAGSCSARTAICSSAAARRGRRAG
jgi:hypothetical protein